MVTPNSGIGSVHRQFRLAFYSASMHFKPNRVLRISQILALSGVFALLGTAQASTPAEKVVCTQAPRNLWLTEAQARQIFGAERYLLVRFKVSRGQCHEFYAVEHDGTVVEAYQHPVTGVTMRLTRIPASRPAQTLGPHT